MTQDLQDAYAFCRAIAKLEAKNFYYAFRVLPRHKSDAMCAVYAFMRKADDLADDESMTLEARRQAMAGWTAAWRRSRTEASRDLVFIALRDAQERFGIGDALLEQLVAGTTMDLAEVPAGVRWTDLPAVGGGVRTVQVYVDQDALEDYCYLVASVVGLVCIRIFGYTNPAAEALAIDTGKAFQLTNVLRDVKEDIERGRIYIPATLLEEFSVAPVRLAELTAGATPAPGELIMLRRLTARAEQLYASATLLIPMLDADSRPAMRVLYEIYHQQLQRTTQPEGIILRERVAVPKAEKLRILAGGMAASIGARIFG